jgi:hypothetical protein
MKYKRTPIIGETVRVHKNLNNGKWSVSGRVKGKGFQVIAHLDSVSLGNAIPKISKAGIHKVRANGVRRVCAYMQGEYKGTYGKDYGSRVSFNPYQNDHFVINALTSRETKFLNGNLFFNDGDGYCTVE